MNVRTVVYGAASLMAAGACALDTESFARPAAERHPETWFHLIGGNVAKAGLDADLDAVKAAGISGIQLFHGQFGGPWPGVSPQIPCLSADWDDLIRHVADGCAARGLVFKMQNCPGWSMSGGPWITPDLAMRNLTYSHIVVAGGASAPIALPVPNWQLETRLPEQDLDYRDLFVLAFPTPRGGDLETCVPKPTKAEDKDGVMRRTFVFDAPRLVSAIELPSPSDMNHPNCYTPDARVQLFAVEESGARTPVLDQQVPQGVWQDRVPMTFACDARTAKTWEFVFTHAHRMNIPQVKFHSAARLNNWEGLAGWVLRGLVRRPAPKQDAAAYVRSGQVLDLTDRFRDGRLAWTPPAGSWTILRIGHVNNGSRNGPAPAEATGWECNKMDRHAIDVHFAAYIGRLAKGPLAGGRLKGFVVDSWECRRQTWTATLEADFRAANGYDFRRKLPAVFGWVLDDPAATERFLLDWRRTLGELVERNYYARMNELARAMGMTAQYETAFGDVVPGDLMSFWKWCDTPMCEFWHPRTPEFVGQDDFKPVYPCASATHLYGKARCAAESFTSMNLKWNERLRDLKRTGNHALARGVTHLVFHTYTHNPRTDWLPPGTSFGHIIGTPFVRGQTWWGAMPEFTDYFARCETLLEAGRPCSDVLWFLGDEVGHKPSEIPPKQLDGFKYDYCNPDALLTRVSAKSGRLVLPDGVSYSVLWVPEGTYVAPKSEAKLKELAAAGARVVRGTPDKAVTGLRPDVVAGPSARPTDGQIEPPFEWIHRTARKEQTKEPVAAHDWYFVCANGENGYKGEVGFRATGGVELWDPVTGARRAAKVVRVADGRTTLAFDFACGESAFVVFTSSLSAPARKAEPQTAPVALSGWRISFPKGWGAPAALDLPELRSWTDLPLGEEARHFSGTATYATTVSRAAAGTAQLDLGRVESVATVFVNGVKVRTLWAPPYRCEIPLKAGANELRVDVTDTWFNRLAYDAGLPEKERKTWTIAAPKKGTKPEPAGLFGPVVVCGTAETSERRTVTFEGTVGAGVREQFADPPPDCRVQAWYHWTTTGISDKCLAADLKAMADLGVGTAHVFMPGQQTLPPETQPLDPEWWTRWETAIAEAKRHGIQLGFHNCPGWSSSGGRWIRPEDSMKMLVACATDVADLSKPVPLAQPRAFHDFYRDVAVYAFPIAPPAVPAKVSGSFAADFEAFRAGRGVLTLPTDRKDPPRCEVVFEYAEPLAPTSLVTTWDESQFHLDVEVSASVDGTTWTRVASQPYRLYNTQLTPKVLPLAQMAPSRFFKLSIATVQPPVWVGFVRRKLARVEFSNLPLVDDLDNKNGASVAHGYRPPADLARPGLAKASVVDVTAAFRNGVLDLASCPSIKLPSDRLHRVLRVGYTTTGKCCAPAPGNVRGLECDKLSKRGLDAHWPHMPHKMINAPGAKGTVAVAIVDSWEVGGQNWTEAFPEEFRRRRGYDIRPWLPAMVGYVVGTAGETARFLYDVQRTVSDLLCENYYDYFAEKCHAEGVLSATESYGGPFDSLRSFRAADVPTGEFWLGQTPHGSPRVASSAGHLNGRLRIGAESFTTEAKEGRWQITPHELRVNGDRGWLDGISQLVYHSYLQQPFDNVQPGFSLDRHGTQLNRHTTWWPEGRWWAKYVHRGQFLLQRGEPKADVLVFAGDSTPNAYSYPGDLVTAGYNFDYCGPRDLERLEARDGGVAMPGRLAYEVLWLGKDRYLSCAALKKIQSLLAGGARIAGRRPLGTPTLMDDSVAWQKLVDEIWGAAPSNLKLADSALKAVRAFGVRAPVEAGGSLKASRRAIEGRDFYFVVNGGAAFDGAVSFKAEGRPERWDCKTGTIKPLAWYADEAGRVKTRLALAPDESAFVSFRAPAADESPRAVWDGPVVEDAAVAIVSARYEARDDAKLGLDVTERVRALLANGTSFHVGNDVLKVRDPASNHYKVLRVDWTADGVARHSDFAEHGDASFRVTRAFKAPEPKVLADLSRDWTITSFTGKNPPAAPLALPSLAGWNTFADEKLRYFAGRAVYEKRVAWRAGAEKVVLDLGDVRELANVWVNGEFLGCLWEAPYRVEIPPRLLADAAKTLDLRLEVVNTWPNRLIGDAKARKAGAAEPRGRYGVPEWVLADRPDSGTGIFTWMNWMKGWTADDEPRPAGLLGPVRLVADVDGDDAVAAERAFRAQAFVDRFGPGNRCLLLPADR